MAGIQLLDSITINQIAAGEVVERPLSVVKELVENAIDAHADAISVEIKDGGISFIRITDNGDGIQGDQVPIAFSRHATSKIRNVEDLLSVSSLGFRGEALSSIAVVAKVELFTKTKEDLAGIHYVIEGGEEKKYEEEGMPDGTTFVIRNLFYNTPARRKFLKSPSAEGSQIQELMVQFALSHSEISFKLIVQNQVRLQTRGGHSLKETIYGVCGREIASQLLEVEEKKDSISIRGYIGKPIIGRGNRNYEHYFINGRYIKSKVISAAIEDAYHGFLMQHKYPFTVLHLEMPSHLLDVNVHPSKMEVRFQNNEEVYRKVFDSVRSCLQRQELIDTVTFDTTYKKAFSKTNPSLVAESQMPYLKSVTTPKEESVETSDGDLVATPKAESIEASDGDLVTTSEAEPIAMTDGNPVTTTKAEPMEMPEPFESKKMEQYNKQNETYFAQIDREERKKGQQMQLFEDRFLSEKAAMKMKLVGQVFATYWIVEYEDKMYIIDQHAAHEKVIYERMMKELQEKEMTSQQVSPPMVVTLTPEEEEKLRVFGPYFEKLGYGISPFGGMDYAIDAVPANLYGLMEQQLFLELLSSLEPDIGRKNETMILDKIASMSCKAAVKGGMKLSVSEAQALFEELLSLENPFHCPHGRPVIVSMTKQELEKKFKRIV